MISQVEAFLSSLRWRNIQGALDQHKKKLAAALEIHAFNRDVDDLNERINEKVGGWAVIEGWAVIGG